MTDWGVGQHLKEAWQTMTWTPCRDEHRMQVYVGDLESMPPVWSCECGLVTYHRESCPTCHRERWVEMGKP